VNDKNLFIIKKRKGGKEKGKRADLLELYIINRYKKKDKQIRKSICDG